MNREKIEIFKQKYPKDWEKFRDLEGGEKLFYEYCTAKEKLKKAKEKAKAISEKERKREARALIILAKLIIKHMDPERLRNFLQKHEEEFIQKERGKTINYLKYIEKLISQ